jgi:hypothetical protein
MLRPHLICRAFRFFRLMMAAMPEMGGGLSPRFGPGLVGTFWCILLAWVAFGPPP